jgi:glycosidase
VLISSPRGQIRAQVQDGVFLAHVPLRSGDNPLSAICRPAGHDVGPAIVQHWDVRLSDSPHAAVRVQVVGNDVTLDAGATTVASGIASPIARYEWHERRGNPAPLKFPDDAEQQMQIHAPDADGRYYVTLRAVDALGRDDHTTVVFRVEGCRAVAVDTQHDHPAWADTAVVYGVALPLFEPDAFQAVTNRIDAIAALGATVLWLSPVTQAPDQDFGYAVTDPFALRTAFGSDAQFRALLAAAHQHGLHVILDAVTNQLSDQSRYFADARARGRSSPYYDWFSRDANGRARHYFNWTNLLNLNYDHPEVRSFLTQALIHWLRAYGADGFRVDAAWGMRQRAPDLWPQVRREIERVNPDVWLLAEASARDRYYSDNGFDAGYDWTMRIGEWAWHDVFGPARGVPDLRALRAALAAGEALPAFRFINNNDTGRRFISLHGVGATRVAAALLFTLPGVPLIYDGDETGAAFDPYSANGPLSRNDPIDLSALYALLAHTRQKIPAMHSRALTLLRTDRDEQVLAYARGDARDPSVALVLLNFSDRPLRVALLPQSSSKPLMRGSWLATDLLTGRSLPSPREFPSVRLSGYGALLLQRVRARDAAKPTPAARCGSSG